MIVKEIQDKHNPSKVWVIKITNCYHYYMNQKIGGRMFYPRFTKTTKKYLVDLGVL